VHAFKALLMITGLLAGVARAAPGQDAARAGEYSLSPGDVLRITVWREPEYSGEYIIGSDGSIQHPFYQQLRIAGEPLSLVRTRIAALLKTVSTATPQFVIVPQYRIVVAGEVRLPNVYLVTAGSTVAQAIAQAGGQTERGRTDLVRVIREGRDTTISLTRTDSVAGRRFIVQSGDEVLVMRAKNTYRDTVAPAASIVGAAAALIAAIISILK
jgi:polysaccharide export outer membrane protein